MTRVPVDGGALAREQREQNVTASASRAGVLDLPRAEERPASAGGNMSAPVTGESVPASVAHGAAEPVEAPVVEPPPKDLVPDIPLQEYVRSFHYEPPKEDAEVTMRGDATLAEPEVTPPTTPEREATPGAAVPVSLTPEVAAPASSSSPEVQGERVASKPPAEEVPMVVSSSVESRLGLDPQGPAEERVERPRFLDIAPPIKNEAVKENKRDGSGTSTIVGPSFLGLSDAPEVGPDPAILEAEEGSRGAWRMWVAVAVVLIFVGLGVMEWRSQAGAGDNGPVQTIRAKFRNWRNGNSSQPAASEPTTSAANDGAAKPEMQVQEQPKPPAADQSANQNGSASGGLTLGAAPAGAPANSANAPAPSTPSATDGTTNKPADQGTPTVTAKDQAATGTKPAADSSSAKNSPAAKDVKQPAPSKTADTTKTDKAAQKTKPAASADDSDDQEVTVKKIAPGAEEMAKAKNASDSAAEAAWLWKATARGNPDAPVQLADLYIKGSGVPRSCEQAVVLLKTAAAKENARARNRLASMYSTGSCVQRNRVEAYRWLSSALTADPDSQWAQQNKNLIWQQMTPDERAMAQKYR